MSGVHKLYQITSTQIKYGLERTEALLKACNNPHKKLNLIQIVGTNGKGTTVAMMSNIFINNNYKTGIFTSPHLVKLNERIQVNYVPIKDSFINQFLKIYKEDIEKIQPSFFEIMTVLALSYFVKKKVDIAIMETGLGGRLDSVTALGAKILLFTSIDYDHMHILGNTIEKITREKCGAITKSTKLIISCKQKKSATKILNASAAKKQKNIIFASKDETFRNLNFLGNHQILNAQLVHCASNSLNKYFNYNLKYIKKSILKAVWPGRIQRINKKPDIIFDVAHNTQSINAFTKYFKSTYVNYDIKYLIVGFEDTKNIIKSVQNLSHYFDCVIFTETKIKNSMSAKHLLNTIQIRSAKTIIENNPVRSIKRVQKILKKNDCLVILGSHYFGPHLNSVFKNCFVIHKKNH